MKIKNITKTKQEQVWEILDKQGYILDNETAKIFGEDRLWCVSEHIRKWKKLQTDRAFFKDKTIVEIRKGYRCHLARLDIQNDGIFYKIGKEFFQELNTNNPKLLK